MTKRPVPRETLEQQTTRTFAELARLLAIASERRATMEPVQDGKRDGGRAA